MALRQPDEPSRRPVMLGIAGDSGAGKTTLTRGLVRALGTSRSTSICLDDYHRYDRAERRRLRYTPLQPACNYMDIIEQHLGLLASGSPVLKPVYDHATGRLTRPEFVVPRDFVMVEGLLSLHTPPSRACFDVSVFIEPPESDRRDWKIRRDTTERGYERTQVLSELTRREDDAEEFIRPQRHESDIVISLGHIEGRDDPVDTPLSATILLRPTIDHPNFAEILDSVPTRAMHVKQVHDGDRGLVEALHVHGYASTEESSLVAKAIWDRLHVREPPPHGLGLLDNGEVNEPLRLAQLILLYHLVGSTGLR
jgi:phosphoribulokinase